MEDLSSIVRMLYPVSEEGIKKLFCYAQLKLIPKGELLIRQQTLNNRFYLVKNGLLRFFYKDEEKDIEDTICFAVTGDAVASLHSYFANLPAVANVEALRDTELYEFSKKDMEHIFLESNELANWGRIIAFEELYALERRYTYVGTGDAYSRYKAFIQMRSLDVFQQIPLKYIASYLGITPQHLAKMRRRFAQE